MKNILTSFLLLAALLSPTVARAKTIEGVSIAEKESVAGKTLRLNGAGLRSLRWGPFPVKLYVAAFYAPDPLSSAQEVLASKGPLYFRFTFLRGFNGDQVEDAWNAQFKASATHRYAGLAADQKKFVSLFGPIKDNGTESVEISGNTTRVYDNGTLVGTIDGRDFQKAFLSMWFGSKPVTPKLKNALLDR